MCSCCLKVLQRSGFPGKIESLAHAVHASFDKYSTCELQSQGMSHFYPDEEQYDLPGSFLGKNAEHQIFVPAIENRMPVWIICLCCRWWMVFSLCHVPGSIAISFAAFHFPNNESAFQWDCPERTFVRTMFIDFFNILSPLPGNCSIPRHCHAF